MTFLDRLVALAGQLAARLSFADVLDILLVAGGIYVVLKLIEGRRASQMAFGTVVVGGLLVVTGSSQLGLSTVQWIVRNTLPYLGIALIVLYQEEIRTGLAQLGGGVLLRNRRRSPDPERETITVLVRTTMELARQRVGAILVWQGAIGLKSYSDTGVAMDARLSSRLLVSLFQTRSPLHDGAAIVRGNRIVAGRCLLPLSQEEATGSGTRHRAALGLTELTDASVIVISEETGHASVVFDGRMVPAADAADLEVQLIHTRAGARWDPVRPRSPAPGAVLDQSPRQA